MLTNDGRYEWGGSPDRWGRAELVEAGVRFPYGPIEATSREVCGRGSLPFGNVTVFRVRTLSEPPGELAFALVVARSRRLSPGYLTRRSETLVPFAASLGVGVMITTGY